MQSRRTSSGLSISSVGMAGTDRTRNCAGERSRIGIGVLHPFRQPSQTSGDFPKEPLDTRDTRAVSDVLAPPTKPRAALKLWSFAMPCIIIDLAPPTKPRAALKRSNHLILGMLFCLAPPTKPRAALKPSSRRRKIVCGYLAPPTKPRAALKLKSSKIIMS